MGDDAQVKEFGSENLQESRKQAAHEPGKPAAAA